MRRRLPIVLGVAATALLLALALRNVSLAEVGTALRGVRPGWLVFMAAFIIVDLFIRALRWKLILGGAGGLPALNGVSGVWVLLRLEAIGLAVNNVVFLRLGELARAVLAGRRLGLPFVTVLATMVVERSLDMAALLTVFGGASLAGGSPALSFWGKMSLAGAVGVALMLALLPGLESSLRGGLLGRLLARAPKVLELAREAAGGARCLRRPKTAVLVALLSPALWLVDAWMFWAGGRAMGLVPPLDYGRSLLVLSTAAASSFLPAVPGSFGAYEQAVKAVLTSFGVGPAAAFGYAGLVHVVNYAVVTGLGIAFLYREGVTFASLRDLR